jgi:hypothetical protein
VHHVNGPGDHSIENLRALCRPCHGWLTHGWPPSDDELLADWDNELTIKQVMEKYHVAQGTAAKYLIYARGLARGQRRR